MLSYSQALLAFWPRPTRACNKIDNLASASGDCRNGGSDLASSSSDRNQDLHSNNRPHSDLCVAVFASVPFRRFLLLCSQAVGELLRRCDRTLFSLTFVEKSRERCPCFTEPCLSVCIADHISVTAAVAGRRQIRVMVVYVAIIPFFHFTFHVYSTISISFFIIQLRLLDV